MIYEIGKYYEVPCAVGDFNGDVGCAYFSVNQKKEMVVPVILPAHEDKEIINFPFRHYHFQHQFMPTKWYQLVTSDSRFFKTESEVYAYVLHTWQSEPRIEMHRLRCKREYPAFPHLAHEKTYNGGDFWPKRLKEAYKGQTLRSGHICPHRGADLSHVRPDEHGCRTCPCHGLIFDKSGVCIGNELITSPSDGAQTTGK